MRKSRHDATIEDFAKTGFSRHPNETTVCPDEQFTKNKHLKRLYYWYVVTYAYTAHHRLPHPEYLKSHVHHTHQALKQL